MQSGGGSRTRVEGVVSHDTQLTQRSPLEVLRGERATLASDVYSFGMVIVEALTGAEPWAQSAKAEAVVRYRVRKGMLPQQPARLSGAQWNLVRMMCAADPAHRVAISFVVEKLHQFSQQQSG